MRKTAFLLPLLLIVSCSFSTSNHAGKSEFTLVIGLPDLPILELRSTNAPQATPPPINNELHDLKTTIKEIREDFLRLKTQYQSAMNAINTKIDSGNADKEETRKELAHLHTQLYRGDENILITFARQISTTMERLSQIEQNATNKQEVTEIKETFNDIQEDFNKFKTQTSKNIAEAETRLDTKTNLLFASVRNLQTGQESLNWTVTIGILVGILGILVAIFLALRATPGRRPREN